MDNDIVGKLRAGFMGGHVLTKAADEIERLRWQNAQLESTSGLARVLTKQAEEIKRYRQQYAELLVEMGRIADVSERWKDSLVSQINEIAREALAKAKEW